MEELRFSLNDPLYCDVVQAFNATHALHIHAHYLSCTPGTVGRVKLETKEGETPA